jgi:hypothetical protein
MLIFVILLKSTFLKFYFSKLVLITNKKKASKICRLIYLFIIFNCFIDNVNLLVDACCILWILFQQFHFFA